MAKLSMFMVKVIFYLGKCQWQLVAVWGDKVLFSAEGREPVESPSLEVFKSCLHMVLDNMLWVALLEQGLDQMDPEVPSNFSYSVF